MKSLGTVWAQARRHYSTYPSRRFLSPVFYAQHRIIAPIVLQFVQGKTIDIGSGTAPFRPLLTHQVTSYDTLDVDDAIPGLTFNRDVVDLSPIAEGTYDTALCLELLEHLPCPQVALGEIRRILRPDGILIASVPHLSRLHDEPCDYWRFTRYGLESLLAEAGFTVLRCERLGGFATFVGHQLAILIISATWKLPFFGKAIPFVCTSLLSWPCWVFDRWIDQRGAFASGHVAVARRAG
jgi:SAM-dependent methyltransferase